MNRRISDITLAPRNSEKSAKNRLCRDWQPGSKPIYFEMNHAEGRNIDLDDPESFSNSLMLREGLTLIWIGWQVRCACAE